jgi:hypothetical protein
MPELSEAEVNDTLGLYLEIIEQQDKSVTFASHHGAGGEPNRSETADKLSVGSKCPGSPDGISEATKRQKSDETEFPWSIHESLSGPGLCDDLQRTLNLLKVFAKDLKLMKMSILTSASAPQFLNSEWSTTIIRAMVDLNRVISGSFAVSSDNHNIEVVRGIQFKFGAVKAIKQVKTSGDWFIAWGLYTQVAVFILPHRRSELKSYGA